MTLIESSPILLLCESVLPERFVAPTLLWVRGDQDISTVVALSQALEGAIAFDEADLLVDMSGVTFLDASTVGAVLRARGQLRRRSRSLAVRSPSTCAQRILELCQLTDLIDRGPVDAVSGAVSSVAGVATTDRVDQGADAPSTAVVSLLCSVPAPPQHT